MPIQLFVLLHVWETGGHTYICMHVLGQSSTILLCANGWPRVGFPAAMLNMTTVRTVIGVEFALWLVGTGPVCIHVRASQLFNAGRELQWHDTKSVVVDSESSHTRVALLENNEKPF